jgi:hypothetical protein
VAWCTKFVDSRGDVCKIDASVQTAVILYCFKVVNSGHVLTYPSI